MNVQPLCRREVYRAPSSLVLILMLLLLGVPAAHADMRCNQGLVGEGDSTAEVLRQCGQPDDRQIIAAAPVPQRKQGNAVTVENWLYGPRNGAYYQLKFLDGKLVNIDVSRK